MFTDTRIFLSIILILATLGLAEIINVMNAFAAHAPEAIFDKRDMTWEMFMHTIPVITSIVALTWMSSGNIFPSLIACTVMIFTFSMAAAMASLMGIVMMAADDPNAEKIFDAMDSLYQGWVVHHWSIYLVTGLAALISLGANFKKNRLTV